jgi:predicted phosphodiesterase
MGPVITRVAVLSDVHGVLPALEAALAEPAVRSADRIVVTGDLAAGPLPVETLDRLLALGDQVVLVRGNADRDLVALAADPTGPAPDPISPWAAQQLIARPDLLELLRGLPHPVDLPVAGFGRIVFCHGTPRDDDEVVLVDTRPERWLEILADLPADVRTVVCGHTHMPFVGAGAHWALLADGAVTLGVAAFDVEEARAQIRAASTYPDVDEFTDYFLHSRASDLEALRVFGPRDGRTV